MEAIVAGFRKPLACHFSICTNGLRKHCFDLVGVPFFSLAGNTHSGLVFND